MVDRDPAAVGVCEFIIRRLDDRALRAEQAEDYEGRTFVLRSRRIIEQMCFDLAERPWAQPELENYLLRTARQYRSHPEYRYRWG